MSILKRLQVATIVASTLPELEEVNKRIGHDGDLYVKGRFRCWCKDGPIYRIYGKGGMHADVVLEKGEEKAIGVSSEMLTVDPQAPAGVKFAYALRQLVEFYDEQKRLR